MAFGEPGAGVSDRANAVASLFQSASLKAQVAEDTERMMWEKFLLIAGTSAATTLCRTAIGPVRSDPDRRWLLESAVRNFLLDQVVDGVPIGPDYA